MVGILADSHDNVDALRKAVRLFRDAGCELILHAGDFVAPFAARELGAGGCPIKAIFGNCDGEKKGLKATLETYGQIKEAPFIFVHRGTRVFLAHLDGPAKKTAQSGAYDVVIYGHTHNPEVRQAGKTLVVNPGETGGWLTGKSTVALWDPAARTAEIVGL